ncbi:MAG TPA: hypothetical protein VJR89_36600 [Polyangiales bacterium]|nr:hypothetical protein [Polyangiales bacterium]
MSLANAILRLGLIAVVVAYALPASAYKVDRDSGTITLTSLADFDKCARDLSEGDACLAGLKAYVDKQPKDAFGAGKRARGQYQHWTALPFFSKALGKAATPEQCQDEDVGLAVASGLALPSDDPNVALARKLAEQCWEQLQPKLLAELPEGGSYYKSNICPAFADRKVAAPECAPAKPAPKATGPTVADQLRGVDYKKLTTDPNSARVLRTARGEEANMIRAKGNGREYVLVKFKNVAGPFNGQVLVTIERPAGFGKDYVTIADGREWTAIVERQGSYEGFAKGVPDTLRLYEVALDRGQKPKPTVADVSSEFSAPAPAKR